MLTSSTRRAARIWTLGLACAALGVFGPGRFTGAAEWSQWRGDARDGVAHQSPPLRTALPDEGLKPLWMSPAIPSGGQGGWSSPIVAGGKVYLFVHSKALTAGESPPKKKYPYLGPDERGGMSDAEYQEYERNRREEDARIGKLYQFRETVYCFDALSGQLAWQAEEPSVYTRFLQSGSPAVVGGRLYILGAGLRARCLDAATGKKLWETQLPGEFSDEFMMSSFAVADGVALAMCGRLMGLDAATGKLLWEGDPQATRGTHQSPVLWASGGRSLAIVNTGGGETICVEPRTGKLLWRVKSEANQSTPVIVGQRMLTYGGSRSAGLRCYELSESGATPLWAYRRVADKGSSPVVVDDKVYVQGERTLACVELATGEECWNTTLDLENPQYTSLIAGDGKVFYAHDGLLAFAARGDEYAPLVVGKIDRDGLLASETTFRRLLNLDALEAEPEGLEKAQKLYQSRIGQHGPLRCSSPALVDGRLYVRLAGALACYDLRAE